MFALLEVRGLDDVGEDQLATLRGLVAAIKAGETTVEEIFASTSEAESDGSGDARADEQGERSGEGPRYNPAVPDRDLPF